MQHEEAVEVFLGDCGGKPYESEAGTRAAWANLGRFFGRIRQLIWEFVPQILFSKGLTRFRSILTGMGWQV